MQLDIMEISRIHNFDISIWKKFRGCTFWKFRQSVWVLIQSVHYTYRFLFISFQVTIGNGEQVKYRLIMIPGFGITCDSHFLPGVHFIIKRFNENGLIHFYYLRVVSSFDHSCRFSERNYKITTEYLLFSYQTREGNHHEVV